MRKYIDADKAIEVCDWYEHEYSECEDYIRTIAEDIRHLPAADVEEVVRCKDCKYLDYVDEHEKWCMGRGNPATMVKDDGYCEIGKRKEES